MKPRNLMSHFVCAVSSAVLMVAEALAPAGVMNWTNTSGGWWNVASNWHPNQVPSTNDVAVITNAGNYTVTLNVNPSIAGLMVGGASGTQTLSSAEQTLTLTGSGRIGPRGVFNLVYGTLTGTNQMDVEGVVNWSGGMVSTNAVLTVATGGRLTIASGANYLKTLHGCITNNGTITWQLYGGLAIGGVLHNLAGGVFEAKLDLAVSQAGSGMIINDGLFRKSGGTGTLICQVPLINNGTVDTQTGRVTLAHGSVFNSGCNFTGAGETRLDSGTNTIHGSIHSENLSLLYNATLMGTGSFSGTLVWSGGTIGRDAAITVATNGNLLIASAANYTKNLYGGLTNAGTITWQPHSGLLIGGVLHNLSGALFDAQMDGLISQGGSGVIINDGVFRKSVGAGTVNCGVPLINNGTVETQLGTLELSDGSRFHEGCAFTGSGGTRLDSGTNTIHGRIHSENLSLLYNATLIGTGSFSGTLVWGGGSIGHDAAITVPTNGTLLIASAANYTKSLYGCLTNAGMIAWQPHSSLHVAGILHNLPSAFFDAQFDGTVSQGGNGVIINDGTFQKSSGAGTTTCYTRFINNGTAKVSSGTLSFEDSFTNSAGTILLSGGSFRTVPPLWLGGGLLTGWGTVIGDVTNAATIRASRSNGVMTINGKYEQLLGGRVEFELGGNTPGVDQSRVNVIGKATLRGTVGVDWFGGYVPAPGTSFPVLAISSHEGNFCCFDNCILLGHGRCLEPVYASASFTLATVAAPEPTTVPLRVTVDGAALVSWPVEFSGYELYWSTNLSQTNWTLIPGITNRSLESPPLPREKFFRLRER
jgi:hypothetical protein